MGKNVFEDLGLPAAEAVAWQARVTLAVEIERYIAKHKLTQSKAAVAFGVPQPTISKIVRGNLSKLSLEYLIRMLAQVGIGVSIVPQSRATKRRAMAA
jgi:predicted XRE-type DNA-binding protein